MFPQSPIKAPQSFAIISSKLKPAKYNFVRPNYNILLKTLSCVKIIRKQYELENISGISTTFEILS